MGRKYKCKKNERRIELGWMDFFEKEKRYKQVKAINGGGTRHLTIDRDKTMLEIKEMAENLFFPNGFSKKKKKLSDYSTEIESSQIKVCSSSTVEEMYEQSKVRILRLYLHNKMKKVELSSEEEEADMQLTSATVVDLTGTEPHCSTEVQGMDAMVEEIDLEVIIGAGENQDVQLDDTLPWNDQSSQGLDETHPDPSNNQPPERPSEQQLDAWDEQPTGEQQLDAWDEQPTEGLMKLAAPFLEEALYSKTTSSLKDTFIQYVSDQEREVLLKALENFDSVDTDALFDALEAHECQQIPTKDNLIPLLSQIGHKALIQAPMYIIDCWRPIVLQLASVLPPDALHHVIQQKKPTEKAVKELLQFPDDMTPAQTAVARYLRRYVGEVDSRTLQLFLRFCTGSNLVEQPIKVEFIEMSDFERRPQSHTWVSFKAACRLP
ncbi:hypothetical protein ABVT39_007352 [Epinephelus coioides]